MAKSSSKSLTEDSLNVIERKAINPNGHLGCLYDGTRDQIIDETSANVQEQWLPASTPPQCEILNSIVDPNFNVLQFIGVEPQLRLSLLLNLLKRTGMAKILNHSQPIDQNEMKCLEASLDENQSKSLYQQQILNKTRIQFSKDNTNSVLRPTQADSHSSSLPQGYVTTSTSDKIDQHENRSKQRLFSQLSVPEASSTSTLSPSPPLPRDDTTNILLLGETGVGKSTFINAFANYLIFNSFEKAESSEPIVIIPVSFIMTIGDHFEECTVKFGEIDSSNNENFNAHGQSVTQHCQSYVFTRNNGDGRKVRIIDTPGFGDTRGLDQDEQNMEHILQYINNLTHLNAICFLLKPNLSRLNIFFRTCFIQLFSLLSPTVRNNIIFCFTNARSTFYTPGNTAPLLKTMFASSSMNDISFKKENTFCFDSESFRYLVALQNDIKFNGEEKQEYEMSWSTSVKEANRLIDYINEKLTVYRIDKEWQSIKHAQFEISYMIRPILETIRNILRNLILHKENLLNEYIEINSKPVHVAANHCRSCKSNVKQVGRFWILYPTQHEIRNACNMCDCTLDQHVSIDYVLDYKCSNKLSNNLQNKMTDILNKLCDASAKIVYFLIYAACSTKDDPFLKGLKEMIREETYICEIEKSNALNLQLAEELLKVESQYKQQWNKVKLAQENIDLPGVYKLIKVISDYPTVHEQMVAVKKRQKMILEEYEYEADKI
ncbi:unnamed protein product [Rotaria sordida]|uniref:G domain-containing protein n=1 Tax=Rotaria sordida TaxID=392033 RepID=A0A818SES8_9BILA|nr:unnamed protein product [Rotaria sordida]